MNWIINGKRKGRKKPGKLTVVGGPQTEDGARELVKGTHPDFVIESVVAVDGNLKPLSPAEPTAEQPPPTPAGEGATA